MKIEAKLSIQTLMRKLRSRLGMILRANPAAPGNGAITILFHAGRLGRAAPEPHR